MEVVDDTHITLRTPFTGSSASGKTYSIDRNYQSMQLADLAADVASVMHKYDTHIDAQTHTVTGMSAYEIVVENGYVGTRAQWLDSLTAYGVALSHGYSGTLTEWLESLKADNEWSTLNSRTQVLATGNIGAHNSIWRGKNLGTEFTDAMKSTIRSGSFEDLYLGDQINGWTIWGFDYFYNDEMLGANAGFRNSSMSAMKVLA